LPDGGVGVARLDHGDKAGEFKRKPEMFWEAVSKYDSSLTDHFLRTYGIDPVDYHFEWGGARP
jgi:hypothetical protein